MKKLLLSLCALFWMSFIWAQHTVKFSGSESATIEIGRASCRERVYEAV